VLSTKRLTLKAARSVVLLVVIEMWGSRSMIMPHGIRIGKLLKFDNKSVWLYNRVLFSKQELFMGYKVVADKFQMDQMRTKYGPRKGLEGPFNFSGRVLYYDNKEGQYYDPTTDFYVEQSEMDLIHSRITDILKA